MRKVCHESAVIFAGYAAHVTDTKLLAQQWLQPEWPAIDGVHALFTTREGGRSQPPFDTMNLGDHVHDNAAHVAANRQTLRAVIDHLSGTAVHTVFLQQVHGCDVQVLDREALAGQTFDACVTSAPGVACTIMVADCLPVFFAHRSGHAVAAAHAGWRGLAGLSGYGVLEATWQAYVNTLPEMLRSDVAAQTQVWLGPCIGPDAFEVGPDVREAFVRGGAQMESCFVPSPQHSGKWLANLPALARQRLQAMGISQIYGNDGSAPWCTVRNASQFFSHRRDAAALGTTGRMAACIWKV